MVSFFGLKFGDKKKKSDAKPAQGKEPHQWKRIDQNALGEGQFFGQNIGRTGVTNGSIRSVSRAGTAQPGAIRFPYFHDTHNLAAASMFDLSVGHARTGSQRSFQIKPHASDVNLRTRFGAMNGSSTSLALPRPGFGSRPGTPNRAKPWVNPLDVHFMRPATPGGPATPRSPLAHSPMQLPQTPTETAETGSVFGEDADEMVDAMMAAVKKREQQEKEAKEREKELEKQRETARLELERLERQKSSESILAKKPQLQERQTELRQKPLGGPDAERPVSGGKLDRRPGSRNGPGGTNGPISQARSPALHQGPPPTGPPTQCLPQPPGQAAPRLGPLDAHTDSHSARSPLTVETDLTDLGPEPGPVVRLNSCNPQVCRPYRPPGYGEPEGRPSGIDPPAALDTDVQRAPFRGAGPRDPNHHGPGSAEIPPHGVRSQRAVALPSALPRAFGAGEGRSQSPRPNISDLARNRTRSPALGGSDSDGYPSSGFSPDPKPSASGRDTPAPDQQKMEFLISTLASPSGSVSRSSIDEEPMEFARPIIRDVAAKRDTLLTLNAPRQQHSLSMRIDELEKTLTRQQAHTAQVETIDRASTSSSLYSDGVGDDEEDDDGPILSIQPAPLRIPPSLAPAQAARPQSPMMGPPRRGVGPVPRRPALEEYGIPARQLASKPRGGTPVPASASSSVDNYGSPPTRSNTPQFRHPNWQREATQLSPASTLDTADRPRPSPVMDTGFNFDFGPGVAGPPTPDSTSWPLSSPTIEMNPTAALPPSDPPQPQSPGPVQGKFTRSKVPPPLNLKFNFSPDAPSRDGASAMWTPPLRSAPVGTSAFDTRPATSAGPGPSRLAASPRLVSQFPGPVPRDDDPAAVMGIGMARGPSIREVRRPGTANGRGMVDAFGHEFI